MSGSNGEGFDYPASILTYLISGAGILLVSMGVSFMFVKIIKRLDMVENLKGMEC